MQTGTYEIVTAKDFKVGDKIYHSNWIRGGMKKYYGIRENTGTHIRCTFNDGSYLSNYSYNDFDNGQDGVNHYWAREFSELQYDPTQQGDTDEDI